MSYILDALRKSERERALGNIRSLEALPVAPAVSDSSRVLRWTILSLVMIALAGALGWAFFHRFTETLSRPESSVDSTSAPASRDPSGATRPDVPASAPQPARNDTSVATLRAATPPQPSPAAAKTPAPPPDLRAPIEPAAPVVLSVGEAPPAIRDALARLQVSVVSYSREPERRFVRINQRFFREGDRLPGGARLSRIEPDGAVVAYRGSEVRLRP